MGLDEGTSCSFSVEVLRINAELLPNKIQEEEDISRKAANPQDLGKAVPLTRAAVQSVLPVEDFPTVEENAYQHVKEVLLAEQQHTALHNKNDPVD